jgi:hypothetical protein
MKKVLLTVIGLAMMFVANAVWAFDAPGGALYGVNADGIYFISADLVKAANGSGIPKLLAAPTFKAEAMKLDGNYYVASGKKPRAGSKTDFCFDIGGGQFVPHALIDDARIKVEDATDNGVGGYNFRMAPK